MEYKHTIQGKFIDRPNRFTAHVMIDGNIETVHVKNTGRCRELLLPGASVILEKSENPKRKTAYDLVTVWKDGLGWVNIDSQAPNILAREWLLQKGFDIIKPEYTYGSSRIDFYMARDGREYLMEVKGCTLAIDGIGYFPDAPTERGIKHMKELIRAKQEGYEAAIAFVITMNGISEVRPNRKTHPAFGEVLDEARAAGVKVLFICCEVNENTVRVKGVVG